MTGLVWAKSSRCGESGACVEVGWRKSTRTAANNACVEIFERPETVAVRDSKQPHAGMLVFDRGVWAAFVAGVARGEFDR